MYNDSVVTVFSILTTIRLCGHIHGSYQHYQPSKKTLQVLVLMIEYLVASSYELWMMRSVLYLLL